MELKLSNLPSELTNNGLFCTWKFQPQRGKVPYDPVTNNLAKSNDKTTFHNYQTILMYVPQYYGFNSQGQVTGGLGLGIFNGFSAIDIDDCIDKETGVVSDMALDIVDFMKSYTEYSPSGTGLRILFKTPTNFDKERYYIKNSNNNLEIYISEQSPRYVTITGNRFNDEYVNINELDITYVLDKYMQRNTKTYKKVPTIKITDIDSRIDKALTNDPLFNDIYHSKADGFDGRGNETDLKFMNMLARILNGDTEAMNIAFMGSPYYHSKDDAHKNKWEVRESYRLETISKAVGNYHQQRLYATETFAFNDTTNATQFAKAYQGRVRWNIENNVWMLWNGEYWEVDMFDRIKQYAEIVIEQMRQQVLNETNLETRKKMTQNINRILNTHGKQAMITEAKHLDGIPITNNMFDHDKDSINTADGIINLKTGDVTPHDPNALHSKYIPYKVDNNPPKLWLKFLSETYLDNPELIDYVQRLIGYTLTGHTTEQSWYVFFGDGSNGKSLLWEIVLKLIGSYGNTATAELLIDNKYAGDKNEQQLARLVGARLVIVEETEQNAKLKESTIKNLTSSYGDVVARVLYGMQFSYRPQFKTIMTTNYKPIIRGMDHGIWRRTKLIPHNIVVPDSKQDRLLGHKLEQELPQILSWAIEGAKKYYESGLNEPKVINDQVSEYKSDMNVIERWIIDNCEQDHEYRETSSNLYKNFLKYVSDNNEPMKIARNAFGTALKRKFESKRVMGAHSFLGVRLRTKSLEEKYNEAEILDEAA